MLAGLRASPILFPMNDAMKLLRKTLPGAIAAMLLLPSAYAMDIEARGVGTARITDDLNAVRTTALRQAKRNAVLAALDKVVGAGTSKLPEVQARLDELVVQVGEESFYSPVPSSADGQYQVSVTFRMDDKALRTQISDLGLAMNTTATRSQPILVMMDEFFTTPTNLRAPLEELTEFRHEEGSHYNEKEAASSSRRAAYAASSNAAYASKEQAAFAVREDRAGRVSAARDTQVAGAARDGEGGEAAVAGRERARYDAASASSRQAAGAASRQVAAASSSSVASSSAAQSAYAHSVNAEDHNNTYFRKLVKYQPQNTGPDSKNYTYNELKGQLGDLDIKVIDNALFKSKYFGNRAITLDQLENSAELARYVDFARKDATADYLMIGSSVIYDVGVDRNSGQPACTGVASTKTFSTRTGEDIGSATQSEAAIGISPDDCRGKLAGKLAASLGNQVGKRIQDFVKRRTMYGAEYVIRLTGGTLSLMSRTAFSQGLKNVPGLEKVVQRQAAANQVEMMATYRGTDPLDQAVAMALAGNPQFATLDSMVDGNVVTLCMNGCTQPKAAR
ncbi:Flagellar assembly protein T N-terminal domain-containing protein [Cupriavidus sp. H19C3]